MEKININSKTSESLFSLVPFTGLNDFYKNNCSACHGIGRQGYYENEFVGDKYVPSLVGLHIKNKFKTKIVNKYGVAYSCDFYPNELVSDIEFIDTKDYEDIYSGSVVYVISSALKDWFNKIYPELLIKNIKIIKVKNYK